MFIESKRTGDRLFELSEKVEHGGNGLTFRRMYAITDFIIPNVSGREHYVRTGTLGGRVECSSDGEKIYPIVSANSWLDKDSTAYAGALVEDSYLINSAIGKKTEGGEYIYSNTYYRKSFCMNSVIINSLLFGYMVIDDVIIDEKSMGLQYIYVTPEQQKKNAQNAAAKKFGCKNCSHYFTDCGRCAFASEEEKILNYTDDTLNSCPRFVQIHTCGECMHYKETYTSPNAIYTLTECALTGRPVSKGENVYHTTEYCKCKNYNCADFCAAGAAV